MTEYFKSGAESRCDEPNPSTYVAIPSLDLFS